MNEKPLRRLSTSLIIKTAPLGLGLRSLLKTITMVMSLVLSLVTIPVAAVDYLFSSTSSTLPPGCFLANGTNYTCPILTLVAGDKVSMEPSVTMTINVIGTFTSTTAEVNVGGDATQVNLTVTGAVAVTNSKVNTSISSVAAMAINSGSEIGGNVEGSQVAGVVTIGANVMIKGNVRTDAGAVTVGIGSEIGGSLTTLAGVVSVGANTTIGGEVSTDAGAITLTENITVVGNVGSTGAGVLTIGAFNTIGGNVSTVVGAITMGASTSVCGNVGSTGAGVVTLNDNNIVGGSINTTAGAITVGSGSEILGDIRITGLGVMTLTGVTVGENIYTMTGAITPTASNVGGTVTASNVESFPIWGNLGNLGLSPTAECLLLKPFHHLKISYAGEGASCANNEVTIEACANEECTSLDTNNTITAILMPYNETITISNGLVVMPLSLPPGTVTLSAVDILPAPNSVLTTCLNTATNATDCSLSISACAADFNCVETSLSESNTRLYTKLAGTPFTLDVIALNSLGTIENDYVVVGASDKNVTVELVDGTGIQDCATRASISPIVSQVLSFDDTDQGRKTSQAMTVNNAHSELRCRVTDNNPSPVIVSCSTDSFSVRPLSFVVTSSDANADSNGLLTSGSATIVAGDSFSLTADTSTAGYHGTPQINASLVVAHAGAITQGALTGVFDSAAVATGTASGSDFKYSEVGYVNLAVNALFDSQFTSVDQSGGDCSDDFSNSLVNGKYGCKFSNSIATNYFGRFIPNHYTVDVAQACSAGDFTYSAQPFIVTVTAKNGLLPPTTTLNYHGAVTDPATANFAKQFTLATTNPLIGTDVGLLSPLIIVASEFSSGVANLDVAFTFNTATTSPMNFQLNAVDFDGVSSSGYETNATTKIRSGRVRLLNAFGSELLDLPVTMRVEYWQSVLNGWQTNNDDSCTDAVLSYSSVSSPDINTCVWQGAAGISGIGCAADGVVEKQYKDKDDGTNFAGNFNLWLKAPGADVIGAIDVTATVDAWLQYNWIGDGPTNPKSRAMFGVYQSNSSNVVHRIEKY